ncbi:MAG: radical SAM protein, partial [Bacteroidales bacterium]
MTQRIGFQEELPTLSKIYYFMIMYLYLLNWFIKSKFFGKRNPLQTVLFVSDECNLACKHCHVYNHIQPTVKTYDQIKKELEYSYQLGSRFVDFEGGEPLIWHDGTKNMNDLIDVAKQIGFYSTTVTTNAQLPFQEIKADSIWVSMDGIGKFHDEIRGTGTFEKLEKNITLSRHKNVSVNMVINNHNYTNVKEAIQYVQDHPFIKNISLNFHTPYAGTESMFLIWEKRRQIIDEIILMKKQGFPIMNSVSGLKLMRDN